MFSQILKSAKTAKICTARKYLRLQFFILLQHAVAVTNPHITFNTPWTPPKPQGTKRPQRSHSVGCSPRGIPPPKRILYSPAPASCRPSGLTTATTNMEQPQVCLRKVFPFATSSFTTCTYSMQWSIC